MAADSSDIALRDRCLTDAPGAWSSLAEHLEGVIRAVVTSFRKIELEDARQEILLRVCLSLPKWRPHDASLKTWAKAIATHWCIEQCRRHGAQKREGSHGRLNFDVADQLVTESEISAMKQANSEELELAMKVCLDDELQRVLVLCATLGCRKAARSLGDPEGTAKTRYRKAVILLNAYFDQTLGHVGASDVQTHH